MTSVKPSTVAVVYYNNVYESCLLCELMLNFVVLREFFVENIWRVLKFVLLLHPLSVSKNDLKQ